MHPYIEFVNPHLGKLLTEIGLNKRFLRGKGAYLYDSDGQEYLDCIAAYGALPFGYNPPEIWQALQRLESNQEPSFIQPSLLEAAGQLGARLVELAPQGLRYVTFANSGAEAVEAAFKLCRAKTGKKVILSTSNSFHGKTLGALSATGNKGYQEAFFAPVEGFRHIPFGDAQALEAYLAEHAHDTAAFIVEPIQGEGGIVEPLTGYLKQVQELCSRYGVLTIFDEIQSGLGRVGTLFACNQEGVTPDVMVIAKALGGGLVPIGAALCKEEVYTEEFGLKHSSTFAGNSLGCRVGLAVVELLTRNDGELLREVCRKGTKLKEGLEQVARRYPQIIRTIRGRGLMLGIEFVSSKEPYPHSLLGVMAEQEMLTPMVASYLLNVEKVRVAPTLNGASVIRIEPPLIIDDAQIERVIDAVEKTVHMLAQRNTAAFLGHLVNYNETFKTEQVEVAQITEVKPEPDDGRFAFLVHPVDLDNYSEFDDSLASLTEEQLEDLSSRWNDMVEPFVVSSSRIVDQTGQGAFGDFICVPKTAEQLLAMDKKQAIEEISAAVKLAAERGAKIVGLGAYTSVVTMGGRQLLPYTDVALTTGNSYTVVSGVEALVTAAHRTGMDLNQVTGAVVGAGGAIGKAAALLLSEQVQRLILVGNPKSPEKSEYRMLKVAVEMVQHLKELSMNGYQFSPGSLGSYVANLTDLPSQEESLSIWVDYVRNILEQGAPLTITVDSKEYVPQADILLVATSSLDTLITPDVVKHGAVICDMSRPSNVSEAVLEERMDVLVIDGGVIAVPGSPDLGWNFGFEKGTAFACMSETIMLALEKRYEHTSLGADLNLGQLEMMRELAAKQGFTLAGFRAFDRPLDPAIWERVSKLRQQHTA
ncbi:MAG: aminotransferase class III-fold pyridoxal phosphate-dependent enzyme [Firmicutes bacterium]|nr:aminotransferase class III-fold pyridoxal phosphate-dependent enzyme [Bacillota bacterium]